MVTMAQRIEELRNEKGMSRPELAAALSLPRLSVEKFETGRQTPTQEQQAKLASFFGVSLLYLRGENNDRVRMEDWMSGAFADEPKSAPAPTRPAPKAAAASGEPGGMFDAFLASPKFKEALRAAALEALKTPEGQKLLGEAIRRELKKLS